MLALDEDELAALEVGGHEAAWPHDTPASLRAFVDVARDVCVVASIREGAPPRAPVRPPKRLESPRKRAQIDAFAWLIAPLLSRASRVVDVGCGHGHLTREIAERIEVPVVGLERDVVLAGRARALSAAASPSFAVTDVLRDGLALSAEDCVIGLHACGELGDAIVESVAASRASVALVGCCLQKRRAPSRRPLCNVGEVELAAALELPKTLLGLSNLTPREEGVEATRVENLAARERRLVLHRLLEGLGVGPLRLGAEIEGLNRRAAHDDLASLVGRAFALRGLAPPSASAIDDAAKWARAQHERSRRLSLPRTMLARVLEVFVLVDRARYLEERGYSVEIGALFPASVSARNLALVASRSPLSR